MSTYTVTVNYTNKVEGFICERSERLDTDFRGAIQTAEKLRRELNAFLLACGYDLSGQFTFSISCEYENGEVITSHGFFR